MGYLIVSPYKTFLRALLANTTPQRTPCCIFVPNCQMYNSKSLKIIVLVFLDLSNLLLSLNYLLQNKPHIEVIFPHHHHESTDLIIVSILVNVNH